MPDTGIDLTDKDVLIAVMGLTGSGKSTFINLATQSPNKLPVGHSIISCTDVVDRADPFDLDGRRIVLFDTPGLDDTNKTETEILRIIAFALETQYRKGQTLHGIIYVHRIVDERIGGLSKTNFGIFRKLCGDKSLRNVVIMTNKWSRLESEDEGLRRVEELANLDDFFKPAIAKGAVMMHQKQDTVESAHEILRQILRNHPIALSIQEEIVDQHKKITETGAGMAVDEKLTLLAQEYERKLKEQLEAAEEARRSRDEETRKEQLEEAERVRQLLEKVEEDKRNQAAQYRLLQEQFAEAERKREQAMREAEERSRRETQAVEARWRQEAEAAERRRAQEKADAEERSQRETQAAEARWRQELEAAERRRAQEKADADEKSRREIQTTEARWRQEFQAAEQRQAKEKEDMEEKLKKMMITPDPNPPAVVSPRRHGTIVSGRSYSMFNHKHESYYATLDQNEGYLIMEYRLSQRRARQQWIFHSKGSAKGCQWLWTIQSASGGEYLCVTSQGKLRALKTSSPSIWCTGKISNHDSQFRIYQHDLSNPGNENAISVQRGDCQRGDQIGVFTKYFDNAEVWVMEGCD